MIAGLIPAIMTPASAAGAYHLHHHAHHIHHAPPPPHQGRVVVPLPRERFGLMTPAQAKALLPPPYPPPQPGQPREGSTRPPPPARPPPHLHSPLHPPLASTTPSPSH